MRNIFIVILIAVFVIGCSGTERVVIHSNHSNHGDHGPVVVYDRHGNATVVQTVYGTTRVHTARPGQEIHIIEARNGHHPRIQVRNVQPHPRIQVRNVQPQHHTTVVIQNQSFIRYRSRNGRFSITIN